MWSQCREMKSQRDWKRQGEWKHQWSYLLIVLIKASICSSIPSECLNYQILSDETRSGNYFSTSKVCDEHLVPGWYRFMGKAGNQLPEQPIINNSSGPFRCKTHATSWLTAPHPKIEDGKVNRTVCFYWASAECYGASVKIFVINCGFYFVYYLSPTSCFYRYCGNHGGES